MRESRFISFWQIFSLTFYTAMTRLATHIKLYCFKVWPTRISSSLDGGYQRTEVLEGTTSPQVASRSLCPPLGLSRFCPIKHTQMVVLLWYFIPFFHIDLFPKNNLVLMGKTPKVYVLQWFTIKSNIPNLLWPSNLKLIFVYKICYILKKINFIQCSLLESKLIPKRFKSFIYFII